MSFGPNCCNVQFTQEGEAGLLPEVPSTRNKIARTGKKGERKKKKKKALEEKKKSFASNEI